jgi:hypothetical protein
MIKRYRLVGNHELGQIISEDLDTNALEYEEDDQIWVKSEDVEEYILSGSAIKRDPERALFRIGTAWSYELVQDIDDPVEFVDSRLADMRAIILRDVFGIEEPNE